MPAPVIYVAVAISAVAVVIVFKEFVYDPHFRPKLSAWREGLASRQRRRARPHVRNPSSTPSDSEDGSQPGKSNELRRPVEYSATSQIELRELIASEVESLKSNGEEVDRTSVRFRHKRNSHDRRVENSTHTLGPKTISQPLISLDGPHISKGDPSTRISELNHRQIKGPIPSPLLPPPTSSHAQNLTVQHDETTYSRTLPVPERSSTSGSVDLLMPTPTALSVGVLGSTGPSDMGLPGPSDMPSVDQYLTSRDQALSPQSFNGTLSPTLSSNLSMELLSSPFYSPPASPFIPAVTYRGSAELPTDRSAQRGNTPGGISSSSGVIESPLPRANPLPVVSADSEVFSLLSQVSGDTDSDEGDYDSASMLGSEMSSWASDVYGEATTQHT